MEQTKKVFCLELNVQQLERLVWALDCGMNECEARIDGARIDTEHAWVCFIETELDALKELRKIRRVAKRLLKGEKRRWTQAEIAHEREASVQGVRAVVQDVLAKRESSGR
jgi:hypothetical protein